MSARPTQQHYDAVAEAFGRKALVYDDFGRDHENLDRMRRKVYDHVSAVMPEGGHLLELNAGTGLDASALVARGFRVHATDLSPGMVAEIRAKIERYGLDGRLTAQQVSFTELDQVEGGPFDGVVSNSGGLNCIDDLTSVTRGLPRVLKPGGRVTFVIMPRVCPWELALVLKDPRVATRRLRPGGVMAHVEGVMFRTYYFSAAETERAFGPDFRRVRREGLSVITPTADNKTFAVNHPSLYKRLVALDDWFSRRPFFNGLGDFFILSMEWRPGAQR